MNKKFKIEQLKPVGSTGIVVKLEPFEDTVTQTESGLYVPTYENYTTDGGRPDARPTNETYSTVATVLAISDKASSLIEEEDYSLAPGDKVLVYPRAKNPQNWLILTRHVPIADFEGYLLLHPNMIQMKINTND